MRPFMTHTQLLGHKLQFKSLHGIGGEDNEDPFIWMAQRPLFELMSASSRTMLTWDLMLTFLQTILKLGYGLSLIL